MPDDRIFGLIIAGTLVCCAALFFLCYVPMISAIYRKYRLPVVTADEQQAIAGEKEADHARRRRLSAATTGMGVSK